MLVACVNGVFGVSVEDHDEVWLSSSICMVYHDGSISGVTWPMICQHLWWGGIVSRRMMPNWTLCCACVIIYVVSSWYSTMLVLRNSVMAYV